MKLLKKNVIRSLWKILKQHVIIILINSNVDEHLKQNKCNYNVDEHFEKRNVITVWMKLLKNMKCN